MSPENAHKLGYEILYGGFNPLNAEPVFVVLRYKALTLYCPMTPYGVMTFVNSP